MKTVEEAEMQQAEKKDVQEVIDQYLTEEDKDRLCSGTAHNDVRMFPGNETFYLYSEANRVKDFIECGHFYNVIGFGIDVFISREFSHAWTEICSIEEIDEYIREMMHDLFDDGYVSDDFDLDKIYAWTRISPHYAMSMTAPIIKKLQDTSKMLWASCVMQSDVFAQETNNVANCMMKNIINKWSETVIIPHTGIGERNLLE